MHAHIIAGLTIAYIIYVGTWTPWTGWHTLISVNISNSQMNSSLPTVPILQDASCLGIGSTCIQWRLFWGTNVVIKAICHTGIGPSISAVCHVCLEWFREVSCSARCTQYQALSYLQIWPLCRFWDISWREHQFRAQQWCLLWHCLTLNSDSTGVGKKEVLDDLHQYDETHHGPGKAAFEKYLEVTLSDVSHGLWTFMANWCSLVLL